MANDPKKTSGGIPGFRFMTELAELVTERLTTQANQVNTTWDKVVAEGAYDLRTFTRDVAKMWVGGYAMAEDVLSFPLRYQQQAQTPWVSLIWNRDTRPDAPKVEITLPKALDLDPGAKATPTRLERLGPDKDVIPPEVVSVGLDGTLLSVSVAHLGDIDPDVGHFVGFVTVPNNAQPIAIIFLAITGKPKP